MNHLLENGVAMTYRELEEDYMQPLLSTSLSIDWFDCGLCLADGIVHEQITVSRLDRAIIIKQFDGKDSLLVKTEVAVKEEMVTDFFLYIDNLCHANTWESDYSVEVCDGFCWEMLIRFGRSHRYKIKGTIDFPPYGNVITRKIEDMLNNTHCTVTPRIFGIGLEDDK